MVVGLLPVSYEQQIVQLHDGDLLAIFSDGVTEAENAEGEQFDDITRPRAQAPGAGVRSLDPCASSTPPR